MNKYTEKIYFFIEYIIPVLVMAGIIFYLSSQPNLGSWISNPLENILRKGAHFTEYGLLTFFVWRLFYNGWKFFIKATFWLSLILVILYAGLDEFHQSFVRGRHGSFIDVIIDIFSAFIVLHLLVFLIKKQKKNIILMAGGMLGLVGIVGVIIWQLYLKEQEKIAENIGDDVSIEQRSFELTKKSVDKNQKNILENKQDEENQRNADNTDEKNNKSIYIEIQKESLPVKINWQIPFTTQAPFSKWDELHEESCEEASLIMLKYYNDEKGKKPASAGREPGVLPANKKVEKPGFSKLSKIPRTEAEEEIQKLVKYQIKKYGDYFDTDAKTIKEIGEDFYGLKNLKIIEKFTILDLKKELAQGNIILVPTAGRELGNPNFTPPGPLYHNLVIIGYDDKQTVDSAGHKAQGVFVTNDPGTRRGQNYKYDQQILYNAIHDFPGDVNKILEGEKRAIVLISEQ